MPLSPRVPPLTCLEALVSVARLRSISAAARELGVSQQTLSARVQTAERLIGITVFLRTTHGVTTTPDGQAVIAWAATVIDAAEVFDAGITSVKDASAGTLRIAASTTIAEFLVPGWSVQMRRAHPGVSIGVRLGNSAEVTEEVLTGAAELGFVESPSVAPGLDSLTVGRDELFVVVAADHPWAQRASVTRAELAATPLILREPHSGSRQIVDALIPQSTYPNRPAPLIELTTNTAIRSAAQTAGAPAVVSEHAVADDLAGGSLRRVQVVDAAQPNSSDLPVRLDRAVRLDRPLRAVWRSGRTPRGAAAKFLAISRQSFPEFGSANLW